MKENKNQFALTEVINYTIATQSNPTIQRDLSKGMDENQEQYAYQHVIPRVNKQDEKRALKIVGVISKAGIKNNKDISFGKWCASLPGSQVESRLLQIQNLPFEQAIKEVFRIIQMANESQKNSGFNLYQFAQMFYYWGNKNMGSVQGRKNRQRLLKDYYRAHWKTSEDVRKEGEDS